MKIISMQVGPIMTNCYILIDEESKKTAVIDPGEDADRILAALREEDSQVEYILLTHGHYDHTTAVPELHAALPQARIYIHQADANGAGSKLFPLASQVEDLLLYDEGDTLALGGLTIQVLHTPGHSPGSVTLQVEDVLFSGDTLFAGSCGRTDLPGGSYDQMMASLKRLGGLEGGYKGLPGHNAPSTLDREREYNSFVREAMGRPMKCGRWS